VSLAEALVELQELTERLRRECPWDREQTAQTIVPFTVEEAYEVADAARAEDDAKLLDELGDLLFQVYFLSLLLQERGSGDLEQVARLAHDRPPDRLWPRAADRRGHEPGDGVDGMNLRLGHGRRGTLRGLPWRSAVWHLRFTLAGPGEVAEWLKALAC
jgi:NTP pyrophosphatase (non-canonical NTP hydrolase)